MAAARAQAEGARVVMEGVVAVAMVVVVVVVVVGVARAGPEVAQGTIQLHQVPAAGPQLSGRNGVQRMLMASKRTQP